MPWTDTEMAAAVARDVADGWVVNLGIGLPIAVLGHLRGRQVLVHSENGILGMGPAPPAGQGDPDVVNAGKEFATIVPGGAFIDSEMSFAIIRGGRLDVTVLGAYQVSERGDLANWKVPGRKVAGIGGAADLAYGAKRVWIIMSHTAKDEPKIVRECTYPLTAAGVVKRVYTDLAILDVTAAGLVVRELAPGVDLDLVAARTGAPVRMLT